MSFGILMLFMRDSYVILIVWLSYGYRMVIV